MVQEKPVDQNSQQQSTSQDEGEYNPDQRPPNIKICKEHKIANRVGIPKQIKGVQSVDQIPRMCPCCANIIENKLLSLNCNLKDLGFLGSGIPLFFEFIKFCIIVCLIIGVCASIQGISINKDGNTCDIYSKCPGNLQQTLSTQNRTSEGISNTYSGLNFLCFFLLVFYSAYFRKRVYTVNNEIDRDNLTPSDYTIMVEGYPKNISDQQIAQHLENCLAVNGKNAIKLQVTKVVQAYDIKIFNNLNNQRMKYLNKQNQLVAQKNSGKSGLDEQISNIDSQIKKVDQQISEFKQKSKSTTGGMQFASSGIAFVSFQKDQYVDFVLGVFEQNVFTKLFSCFFTPNGYKVGNAIYPLKVRRAPEPTDIIWENISIPESEKQSARIKTYLYTLIAIGASFGLIYLFSYLQEKSKEEGGFKAQGLSLAASFVIMFLNTLIQKLIRIFAIFEKHNTYTHYQASVAKKLGLAQFINTAAVTYLVNIIFNGKLFIGDGGLVSDISYILLINAVLPPILEYLNPFHMLKFYKIKKIEEDPKNCHLTQQQAHSIFQGPAFDIAKHYASCVKIMLSSCFFIYLMPYAIIFPFFGLIFFYWQIKYQLLRRSAKPNAIGAEISHQIIDFSVELIILVYSIGCFIFESTIFDTTSSYTIVQFSFSIIYYIFPIYKICLSCANTNRQNSVEQYNTVQGLFTSDYDRTNPVTQQEALQSYMSQLGLQVDDQKKQQFGGFVPNPMHNPYRQQQNMPTFFGMQPIAQSNINSQQYQQQRFQQMQMQRMQYQNQMVRQQLNQMHGQNQMQNRNNLMQQFQQARQNLMMNFGNRGGPQIRQVGQPQFMPTQYSQQPQQMIHSNVQQIYPQNQVQNRIQVVPQNGPNQSNSNNDPNQTQQSLLQNMQRYPNIQNQQPQMYQNNQQQGIQASGVIPMVNNNNNNNQQQYQQNQQQYPMNQNQMMMMRQQQQGYPQQQQFMYVNPMNNQQWQPQNPMQPDNQQK